MPMSWDTTRSGAEHGFGRAPGSTSREPGAGMSWQPLLEFVGSTAYGVLSALIPIFNSEIYIVASQVGGFAD